MKKTVYKGEALFRVWQKEASETDNIMYGGMIPIIGMMLSMLAIVIIDRISGIGGISDVVLLTGTIIGGIVFSVVVYLIMNNHVNKYTFDNEELGLYWGKTKIDDLNKIVMVGEDKDGIGEIRRLHAILGVDEKGYLSLTDNARILKESEEYKESLCLDSQITKEEWKQKVPSILQKSKDLEWEIKLRESKQVREEKRKDMIKEQEQKDEYLRMYNEKHGKRKENLSKV